MERPRRRRSVLRALAWIGTHELGVLLALGVALASLWGFFELAGEVSNGDARAWDREMLEALRVPGELSNPIGPEWLESMVRDITALGSTTIVYLITLLVLFYLLLRRDLRATALVAAAVLGGQLLSTGLKTWFGRPRPALADPALVTGYTSFPSGHTVMATVTYLTLAALLARMHRSKILRAYFLVAALMIALLVAMSRVYLGVHWPTDVLAGLTVGAGWASFCWIVARTLQRRGRIEPAA